MFEKLRAAAERRRLERYLRPFPSTDPTFTPAKSPAAAVPCRCPSHRTAAAAAAPAPVVTLADLQRLVPAVSDLQAGRGRVWQRDDEDALAAYSLRRLAEHEEQLAYRSGAYIAGPDSNLHGFNPEFSEARVLSIAADYLSDGDYAGARLAALVLAGFTGVPMEAVR